MKIHREKQGYNQFFYGPNGERRKEVYSCPSGVETMISLSKLLEVVTEAGVTDWRHYIYAAGQRIGLAPFRMTPS